MSPPKYLEKLFRLLLPPASREHVLGDLQERYQSPKSYLIDAFSVLGPVIVSRIRRTTDFQVFLMEACAVYFSFAAAAWCLGEQRFLYGNAGFIRLLMPTTVALAALLLCNAYSDPGRRSFSKPVLQSAGSISLAVFGQTVLFNIQPNFAVPLRVMLYGGIAGFCLASTLRMLFTSAQSRPHVVRYTVVRRRPPYGRVAMTNSLRRFHGRISEVQNGPKFSLIFGALILALILAATLLFVYHCCTT